MQKNDPTMICTLKRVLLTPPPTFTFGLLSDRLEKHAPDKVSAVPTLRMFLPCHEREDGFSVVVGLLFTGRSGVLAIVGQFIHPSKVTDGVAEEEGISVSVLSVISS